MLLVYISATRDFVNVDVGMDVETRDMVLGVADGSHGVSSVAVVR